MPGASDEAVACDAGPGRKLPAERQVSSLLRNVTQQHCDDFVSHILHGPVFARYSRTLVNRLGVKWERGLQEVVREIHRALS